MTNTKTLISLSIFVTSLYTQLAQSNEQISSDQYLFDYSNCIDENGGPTNGTVAACANRTADIITTEIEATLSEVHSKLEKQFPEEAKVLISSQQDWITYRDGHCHLLSMFSGGAMEGYCPMQLNLKRLEQLKELKLDLSHE